MAKKTRKGKERRVRCPLCGGLYAPSYINVHMSRYCGWKRMPRIKEHAQ